MNELYCPKCEYLVVEDDEETEDNLVFCTNCLAWSSIEIDPNSNNSKFYLEFSFYATTTNRSA